MPAWLGARPDADGKPPKTILEKRSQKVLRLMSVKPKETKATAAGPSAAAGGKVGASLYKKPESMSLKQELLANEVLYHMHDYALEACSTLGYVRFAIPDVAEVPRPLKMFEERVFKLAAELAPFLLPTLRGRDGRMCIITRAPDGTIADSRLESIGFADPDRSNLHEWLKLRLLRASHIKTFY